jgi:hypothetical protein
MSLSATIKGAVDKAFAAAGDLVKTATLSNTTATSYDFAKGKTISTSKSETVSIIMLETKSSSDGIKVTAILKSGVDLDVYDVITVDGVEYRMADYSDNGYSIDVTLLRGL